MKAYTQGITKNEFVAEMKKHQATDAFITGTYEDESKEHFRGCSVGCALKSVSVIKNIKLHFGSHREFETHLGVPEWLARLNDKIFENVPKARTKTWPVEFSEAINEGSDLDKIKIPFLIFIVESARAHTKNERSLAAIDGVLIELKKDVLDLPKLREARAAAYAAAYAAAAYADAAAAYAAAAYAADAYAADAYAAYAADAYAAADAAAYAADAYAAARENQFTKFADKLLELMWDCK